MIHLLRRMNSDSESIHSHAVKKSTNSKPKTAKLLNTKGSAGMPDQTAASPGNIPRDAQPATTRNADGNAEETGSEESAIASTGVDTDS